MRTNESLLVEPEYKYGLKGASLFKENRTDKDILRTMNEDTYEELVTSWAFHCIKSGDQKKYEDVFRLGGPGDGGIDVIAYYNIENRDSDIYQCKHYNHPVNRSDVIAELGKFLYHVYKGVFKMPRNYFLMTPQGLSAAFNKIYSSCDKLKESVILSWDKDISNRIQPKNKIPLDSELKAFLEEFDYKKFKMISPDKMLEDLLKEKNRHVYFQYFGVKKDELVRMKLTPPVDHKDYESKYIGHLVDAYNDVEGGELINADKVDSCKYAKHFGRSREEFWLAESVRKMSEENCPGDRDEYKELQNDMLHHVADTHEADYKNAFERVKAVTAMATSLQKKDNRIISGELSSGELKGVCFQLSNEDKLIWKNE